MSGITRKILLKTAKAILLSVAATLAIAHIVVLPQGGRVAGAGLLLCIICPILIGGPASALQFYQQEKLRRVRNLLARKNAELRRLHRQLGEAHTALAEIARRDDMTGALNRASFMAALQSPGAGTLLFIDADHFKDINDTYGHLAGDQALRAIAGAIRSAIGETALFGRIGGEEFAVFLPGLFDGEAAAVAENIRKAVCDLEVTGDNGERLALTVSIGSAGGYDRFRLKDLWREADRRLYEAKHAGRNRIVMGDIMSDDALSISA